MLSRMSHCTLVAVLALVTSACSGSANTPSESPAPGDVVMVRIVNRTAEQVILWYVYNNGGRNRFTEVAAGRTEDVSFPWRPGATQVSFEARAASRTRREDRASNALPVTAGVRLVLVVETTTLFVRNLDEQRR